MKRLMNRILSALFAFAATGATAETHTWTPGVSGLWSDSLKWTPNGVSANGDIVAFGGAFGSWEMFSGTSVVSTNIKLAVGSDSNAGFYIHGGKLTLGRYSQFGCAGRSEVFVDGGELSFPNKTMSLVDRGSDTEDYPSVLTIAGDARVSGFNILPYGDRSSYEGMSRAMVNLNGSSLLSSTDAFNVKAAVSSSRVTLSFNGGTLERVAGSPDFDANKNLLKGIDAVVYSGGGRLLARKFEESVRYVASFGKAIA